MSFSSSLQLLLATGSTRPWRQASYAMPLPPPSTALLSSQTFSSSEDSIQSNGAIARRYGSSPTLTHPPNTSPSHTTAAPPHSHSTPASRRTPPSLNSRSVLSSLSSHLSSRLLSTRGLLVLLCTIHTVVVVCVLLWLFSTSSSYSSSAFASSVPDASPFASVPRTWDALLSKMDLNTLRYSSPVSIRPLSNNHPLAEQPPQPVNATDAAEPALQPTTEKSGDSEIVVAKQDESAPLPTPPPAAAPTHSPTDTVSWTPLAPLDVPLAAFFNQLQHEHCADSSSSPPTYTKPVRSLLYSCSTNAVRLEHADELYEQHSLAGLYSMLRAATLAAASNRTLFIDDSHCNDVRSLPEGAARDAGLLCCEWRSLFQPLSSCAVPDGRIHSTNFVQCARVERRRSGAIRRGAGVHVGGGELDCYESSFPQHFPSLCNALVGSATVPSLHTARCVCLTIVVRPASLCSHSSRSSIQHPI